MSTAITYWLIVLAHVKEMLEVILITLCVIWSVLFFLWVVMLAYEDEEKKKVKKFLKVLVPVMLVVAVIAVFMPNKSEIVAIYSVPHLTNGEINKVPTSVAKIINRWAEKEAKGKKTHHD